MKNWPWTYRWQSRMSPRRWILVQTLCFLSFLLFSQTPLALDVQRNLTAPINFQFRNWMKKNPQLDPRIKIYAYDDSTQDYVGRQDLSLGQWAEVIRGLASTQPASIYVDKMFTTPDKIEEELHSFQRMADEIKVPLVTDVWITPNAIAKREQHRMDLEDYDIQKHKEDSSTGLHDMDWLPIQLGFLYGPHRSLQSVFKNLGHAVYFGQGEVHPLIRLTRDRFIPHWSLLGANQFTVGEKGLKVNGIQVPLTDRHSVIVNFLDVAELRSKLISFRSLIYRADRQIPFTKFKIPYRPILEKGQYIVILPAMYTGNTDFINTPQGYIPGGFNMVAMLNSALTGHWLESYRWNSVTLLLLCLVGGLIGLHAGPLIWPLLLFAGNCTIALVSMLSFSQLDIVVPWELLAGAFSISSLITFASELQFKTLFEHDEKGRRDAMLQAAQAVQEALLPSLHDLPAIDVAAHYRAAEATGGDWYGIYPSEDSQRIFIFIGDVTGHGFSSALLTGVVSGGIKTLIKDPSIRTEDPGIILKTMARSINDLVYRTGSKASRSMTMTFACIDLKTNMCHFLNGGHCPPFRIHEQKVNPLVARGDILGFAEHFRGEAKKIQLEPGDMLLFYTDGLLENEGPDGRHLKQREIWDCLRQPDQSVDQILQHILSRAEAIWQEQPPMDDCTFFIIRLKGLDQQLAEQVTA